MNTYFYIQHTGLTLTCYRKHAKIRTVYPIMTHNEQGIEVLDRRELYSFVADLLGDLENGCRVISFGSLHEGLEFFASRIPKPADILHIVFNHIDLQFAALVSREPKLPIISWGYPEAIQDLSLTPLYGYQMLDYIEDLANDKCKIIRSDSTPIQLTLTTVGDLFREILEHKNTWQRKNLLSYYDWIFNYREILKGLSGEKLSHD